MPRQINSTVEGDHEFTIARKRTASDNLGKIIRALEVNFYN